MLVKKIQSIYPDIDTAQFDPRTGCILLQDDGNGPYIASWSHPSHARPTQAQLDAIVIDLDAPEVPATVTPKQVRLILLQQGLLDTVEAMIATQDKATQITWEFASVFERNNPLLKQLAVNLSLTDEQIDQFFIAAAQL